MLGDLGQDRALLVTEGEIDRDGVEDLGHPVGRELDVDHRAGDLDDPAHTLCFSHVHSSDLCPNTKNAIPHTQPISSAALGQGLGTTNDL